MRPLTRLRAALQGRALPLLCGLAISLMSCEPDYEGLSVQLISSPPNHLPIEVGYPWIRLPLGVALAVEIQPQSSNQEAFESDAQLTLKSQHPEIAQLLPTSKPRRFVVVGTSTGETPVKIFVDDKPLGVMNIEVTKNAP